MSEGSWGQTSPGETGKSAVMQWPKASVVLPFQGIHVAFIILCSLLLGDPRPTRLSKLQERHRTWRNQGVSGGRIKRIK